MAGPLGIIAGSGALPRRIIGACRAVGRDVFVVAIQGHAEAATVDGVPHAWVRLGAAGAALDHLREAGAEEIVMAGAVRRPSLVELRPDARAARFLAGIGYRALGDDGLLSAVVRILEKEGFRVSGAGDILGRLQPPPGPLGRLLPDEAALRDIRRGIDVLTALGKADVGQAVAVQDGIVLAVEAVEGTDAMLARCAELKRAGPGGVLVKGRKPGQEDRVDMPTVGQVTVEGAHRAGLRGIALEYGGTLVVDAEMVRDMADSLGLFVVMEDFRR